MQSLPVQLALLSIAAACVIEDMRVQWSVHAAERSQASDLYELYCIGTRMQSLVDCRQIERVLQRSTLSSVMQRMIDRFSWRMLPSLLGTLVCMRVVLQCFSYGVTLWNRVGFYFLGPSLGELYV